MGDLIELGPITFPAVSPRLGVVLLADGPCAGAYAQVPGNQAELWQRVGRPQRVGVESQMWACYRRAIGDRFLYSGITVTTDELQAGLCASQEAGHTYGESHGV